MNCLVTGATGFIGSALVERLVHEGHHVRAVLHTTPPRQRHQRVEYVSADMTDSSSLPTVTKDIDIVFHCAALVKDYGSTKEILKVNLQGTRYLTDACGKQIQKFVFLSHLHNTSTTRAGAYSHSKAQAENYLLEKHRIEQFPAVIIRPGNVYGPGASTWVVRPLRSIQQDRIALINNGNGIFLHTYIDNLIDALIAAMDAPSTKGEIMEITDGDNQTTWKTYFNDLATLAGKPPITRTMTKTTALLLSHSMMLRYHLFHREPLVTPTAVHILTNQRTVSLEKARTLLGYRPLITYSEAITHIGEWLRAEQYI
jgi:nucleoside-diphosphate-sugar epimerase